MARIIQQPAYVLHGRPYRETSLLLEVLSRDHGRAAMVARGARGPKSRLRHVLQPFRPLLISWSGRGELGTLSGAEQVAAPPSLQGESLYCGLYINELLTRLLHRGDPHPETFERYTTVLGGLAAEQDVQPLLRCFERDLLEDVGYGLMLDHEFGAQRQIDPSASYEYRPGQGPVRLAAAVSGQKRLISGAALIALSTGEIEGAHLPELRRLMRRVIRYHVGDKPLASQALFLGLRKKDKGP